MQQLTGSIGRLCQPRVQPNSKTFHKSFGGLVLVAARGRFAKPMVRGSTPSFDFPLNSSRLVSCFQTGGRL